MPSPDENHTGARIKEQRRIARLTQRELAGIIPYSYSLLNQVECGARAATPDFVAAVAAALRIDVTVLTGQPYVTELQQDRLSALVRPIRESLDLYDLGADPALEPRPAAQLVGDAADLCQAVRATHLRKAAVKLPGLIAEITSVAWRTPTTELWQALASTYRTAHDIAVKLGYFDLSSVALDRMAWAADRASDASLAAVRQYMRALVYFREGEYTIGQRLIRSGHGLLQGDARTRETIAVTGQLHLGATVIAARARDQHAVDTHLEQAANPHDRRKAIGMGYLGPTISVNKDHPTVVKYRNELPTTHMFQSVIDDIRNGNAQLTPTAPPPYKSKPPFPPNINVWNVVHQHGGFTAPQSDGMPLQSFSPDGFHAESYTTLDPSRVKPNEAISGYTNHERSSMLWYHDHGMGMTSLNVYAGLAGLYLIRDPADERLGLPRGEFEVPLILQDRTFHRNGSLAYTMADREGEDTPVVNGKAYPFLAVEPRRYRLRILNASNERFWRLTDCPEARTGRRRPRSSSCRTSHPSSQNHTPVGGNGSRTSTSSSAP